MAPYRIPLLGDGCAFRVGGKIKAGYVAMDVFWRSEASSVG
jgi:hypothetical protein